MTGTTRKKAPAAASSFAGKPLEGKTFEEKWNRQFELLCAFQCENNHCRVPHNYEFEGVNLGKWVSRQREHHKNLMEGKNNGKITEERIDLLNSIGLGWSAIRTGWDRQFELLRLSVKMVTAVLTLTLTSRVSILVNG